MSLSREEVKRIAKLARLKMDEADVDKFSKQLSGILEDAKLLDEVDVEGVEPIAQITGLESVSFEDEVKDCDHSEQLLDQSPQGTQDRMIKVKNVF